MGGQKRVGVGSWRMSMLHTELSKLTQQPNSTSVLSLTYAHGFHRAKNLIDQAGSYCYGQLLIDVGDLALAQVSWKSVSFQITKEPSMSGTVKCLSVASNTTMPLVNGQIFCFCEGHRLTNLNRAAHFPFEIYHLPMLSSFQFCLCFPIYLCPP